MSLHQSLSPAHGRSRKITLNTSPDMVRTRRRSMALVSVPPSARADICSPMSMCSPIGLQSPLALQSPQSPFPAVRRSTVRKWSKTRSSIILSIPGQARHHLRTIWLFTRSDLKTIVGPQTSFGLLHALSASAFDISLNTSTAEVMRRAPLVILWTWINLLPFNINNQRQPDAIVEDAVNKPWRPMPSKRLTPNMAKRLMLAFYVAAFFTSILIGGLSQHLALIMLGYMYNNLGGADASPLVRNLINGLGIVSFGSGAMEVALGSSFHPTSSLMHWFSILVLVIATTVQTQDMYDQEGDNLRGRRTLPLCIGDMAARYTIAIAVAAWAIIGPWIWESRPAAYGCPVFLASLIAIRTLTKRQVHEDKATFKLWNLWMVSIYTLPLVNVLFV